MGIFYEAGRRCWNSFAAAGREREYVFLFAQVSTTSTVSTASSVALRPSCVLQEMKMKSMCLTTAPLTPTGASR